MTRRDVFQAIADPTRRRILASIAHQSLNVNTIAEQFTVTRAAIYKHMKILSECGLVEITQQGRERFCEAKLQKLEEVDQWLGEYRALWGPLPDTAITSPDERHGGKSSHKKKKKHGKKKRKH